MSLPGLGGFGTGAPSTNHLKSLAEYVESTTVRVHLGGVVPESGDAVGCSTCMQHLVSSGTPIAFAQHGDLRGFAAIRRHERDRLGGSIGGMSVKGGRPRRPVSCAVALAAG